MRYRRKMTVKNKERSIVHHPEHYTQGEIECCQALHAMLGDVGYLGYCRGNAVKYLWRCMYKDSTSTDLRKARWYAEEAIKVADRLDKVDVEKDEFWSKVEAQAQREIIGGMEKAGTMSNYSMVCPKEKPETD